MHIVEELIAERAEKLMAKPRLWRAIKPALYKALGYQKAVTIADKAANLSGFDAFAMVSADMQVKPQVRGAKNIPADGAIMIISNHPTGLADGIFVFDALKSARPDHIFMANADALRVIPKGEDIIIPVEWVKEKRSPAKTRNTLRAMKAAFEAEKAVVIFPSGVLAKLSWRGLTDKDWNTTAVSMARKYGIPIVPLRIQARRVFSSGSVPSR